MGRREKRSLSDQFKELLILLFVIALLPIWIPGLLIMLALMVMYYLLLNMYAWIVWLPKGQRVLFIFSDSPIWHDYIQSNIIPRIEHCSVILNWSQRKQWPKYTFPIMAFRFLGGERAYNPLAIIFRPMKTAKIIRLWEAFKSYKHGDSKPLEQAEAELFKALKIGTA